MNELHFKYDEKTRIILPVLVTVVVVANELEPNANDVLLGSFVDAPPNWNVGVGTLVFVSVFVSPNLNALLGAVVAAPNENDGNTVEEAVVVMADVGDCTGCPNENVGTAAVTMGIIASAVVAMANGFVCPNENEIAGFGAAIVAVVVIVDDKVKPVIEFVLIADDCVVGNPNENSGAGSAVVAVNTLLLLGKISFVLLGKPNENFGVGDVTVGTITGFASLLFGVDVMVGVAGVNENENPPIRSVKMSIFISEL